MDDAALAARLNELNHREAEVNLEMRVRLETVIQKAAAGTSVDSDMRMLHEAFEEHWRVTPPSHGNITYSDVVINASMFLSQLDRKIIGRAGGVIQADHGSTWRGKTAEDKRRDTERRMVIYEILIGVITHLEGGDRAAKANVVLQKHIDAEIRFARKLTEHMEQNKTTLRLMGFSEESFAYDKMKAISQEEIDAFLRNEAVLERQIQDRESTLPWAMGDKDGTGNFWGFNTYHHATNKQPPDTLVPARLQPTLKRVWKNASQNHLIAVMQRKNAYCVRYTIEFDVSVRNLSRPEDWRLSLERRDALKYACDDVAEEMGILFAIEGLEAHGATKGQSRSRQVTGKTQTAEDEADGEDNGGKKNTRKKRTTSEKKKNVANPRMGGLGELLEEHEEDAIAQAEEIQAVQDEKDAAQGIIEESEVRKSLKERAAAASARLEKAKGLLKENQMKKLSEFIELKWRELGQKQSLIDFKQESEQQVSLWLDFMREELQALYSQPTRTITDNAYIKLYEKASQTLREALPNVRRGLSHIEFTLAVRQDNPLPIDPCFFAKIITAPLVLRCVGPPRNTPMYKERVCLHCHIGGIMPVGAVVMPTRICEKGKEPGVTPCEWGMKCIYCVRVHHPDYYNIPPYLDKTKYPDEFRNRQYGYLRFSYDHKGGYEWKDVKPDINLNRSIKHWMYMLLYGLKSWRCKLVRAWLACVGRNQQRLSTLLFYGDPRDFKWNQMVKNWVFHLYKGAKEQAPDEYFSLSPEADHWVYDRTIDRPVVQKKKDKYFFLDRLANYMKKNGYYIAHGSEAVLKKLPRMERSAELCVQHFFSNDLKIPPEETFMGLLVKEEEDDWLGDVADYGHIFGPNPALRARFPFARRRYNLIEGEDFFFAMFRRGVATEKYPLGRVEWPEWLPRDGLAVGVEQCHKLMPKFLADGKTLNQETLGMVDRLLGKDGVCAHGLYIKMEEFTRPPIQWFAAIGKYYKEPHPVYEMNAKPEYDKEGRLMPAKFTMSKHWGKAKFNHMLNVMRTVLFEPLGDGQRWPWFWGDGGTGKSSMARNIIRHFYHDEELCVCKGNYATSDMGPNKRCILFEDFVPGITVTKRDDFVSLLDVGKMNAEGKRKNSMRVVNNCVKVGDSNPIPVWSRDTSHAIERRLWLFETNLSHKDMVNVEIGVMLERYWYRVIYYLGSESFKADPRVVEAPNCIHPDNAALFDRGMPAFY